MKRSAMSGCDCVCHDLGDDRASCAARGCCAGWRKGATALAAALLRAEQALTREGEMFAQATERMLQANDLHVALTAAESRAEVLADALRLERAKALEDAAREVEGYVGAGRAIWPSDLIRPLAARIRALASPASPPRDKP